MDKIVKNKKAIHKRCQTCNGIGLIKRKPIICKYCSALTIKSCMYCENMNKGLYEECDNCIGTGIHKYKITYNTIV